MSDAADVDLALSLTGVTKRYGATRALDGLDLRVPRGSIFGLVGPNGAGKTTTFGIVCGYIRPDAGTVDIFGQGPFDAAKHRGRLSALPQDAELGRGVPLAEQLEFLARLQGLDRQEARQQVQKALELADMRDRARARSKTLSHGMLRRVAIAQAFIGSAELVLLDEPTNGLDPRQAHNIRSFIREQRGHRTVIVSSHNLNEIESICDHVGMVNLGKVVKAGPVSVVTGRDEDVQIVLGNGPLPMDAVREALSEDQVSWNDKTHTLTIRFTRRADREAEEVIGIALKVLLENNARISGVSRGQSLERAYLAST